MATTTRILNSRNINGDYTSPTFRLPNTLTGSFSFKAVLTDAQFLDPSKSLSVMLQLSLDGNNWGTWMGFTWFGGQRYLEGGVEDTNRPGVEISNSEVAAGKYVRVLIHTGSILNVGFDITYTPV